MSFLIVQEIPKERAHASGFSTKAKDASVRQETLSPKGKNALSLQKEKSTEDHVPQVEVEGSGSSCDPLATPGGRVNVIFSFLLIFIGCTTVLPMGVAPKAMSDL